MGANADGPLQADAKIVQFCIGRKGCNHKGNPAHSDGDALLGRGGPQAAAAPYCAPRTLLQAACRRERARLRNTRLAVYADLHAVNECAD